MIYYINYYIVALSNTNEQLKKYLNKYNEFSEKIN